ncbi:hypothetical protein IJU97_05510 [bacterium]|nr:hypothetical protein [bacterium]
MVDESAISEAEKITNRKMVSRRIEEQKRFIKSALYREIVGDEDDEIE